VAAQKMPFEIPIRIRFSKLNVPGYVGLCQFRRHLRRQNAFEQTEMILPAA